MLHASTAELWALINRQHGVVTRAQLLEHGYGHEAIRQRLATGRLHRTWPGVYAVGRPRLTQHGRWMAAVLGCGSQAVLSHRSAAALWGISRVADGPIEISVPRHLMRRRRGLVVHRRAALAQGTTRHEGIPVTNPAWTLLDLAMQLSPDRLEAAVNAADKLDLVDPGELRAAVARAGRRAGAPALRKVLDHSTFVLTDSELERRLVRIARKIGTASPLTGVELNGFKVDFYWPDLGLVVETDGLRYHRTPAQQARDRIRDQAHTRAGLTPLRFTRAQVKFDMAYVEATLLEVVARLRMRGPIPVTPLRPAGGLE